MTDIPDHDDEPLGPDDGHINRLTGEVYDEQQGDYRAGDEEPPMFTDTQFDEVIEFFRGLVQRRVEHPTGELLQPENRNVDRLLHSIAYHSGPRAGQIQSLVRGMMRLDARSHGLISDGGLSPYSGEIVRDFNLKPYVDAADRLRRTIRDRRRRVRGAGVQQRRVADASSMSVEEMLQSDSAFLVAVGTLLQHRRGRIWWDDFQKNYFTDWGGGADDRVIPAQELGEDIILNIKVWIIPFARCLSKLGTLTLTEAIQHVAKLDRRNELTEWLGSLRWDGVERLKDMAQNVLGCEGEYASRAIKNMMVSAVARAFNPGCQMSSMVVIHSVQDLGKSKLIKLLAGARWYREVTAKPNDKDFVVNMQGGWLLEVAELASLARYGTDDPVVKDAISRASDFIRPPYGRVVQEYKRSSIFIGTTNEQQWHSDTTGGKRWWPVYATKVDLDYAEQHREQLWAEAVKAYADGWAYWEVPLDGHREALAEAAESDALEDKVFSRLVAGYRSGGLYTGLDGGPAAILGSDDQANTETERFGTVVTLERVGVWWMGINIERISEKQRKVAKVLTRLGWCSRLKKIDGWPHRIWVPTEKGAERLREAAVTATGYSGGQNSDQWNLIPEG